MDFLQRGTHQNQTVNNNPGPGATVHTTNGHSRKRDSGGGFIRYITVALLFALTVLVVLLIAGIFTSHPKEESSYIDKSKMQAVFLNNGQVYFGNIAALNNKYLQLHNIYYLRVNQTVQPNQTNSNNSNDVSLVKLGCELHGPSDEMLINRDQVTFWENLKTDGQVAKAVSDYVKANPNGQTCTTAQSNTNSSTPSSNNSSNSNGSNSTTNKKQ